MLKNACSWFRLQLWFNIHKVRKYKYKVYLPENFSFIFLLNSVPNSFDTKTWYSPSLASDLPNTLKALLPDEISTYEAGSSVVPLRVHLKVCGPEAGLPLKLKRTEEYNLLALKFVMSGVSSVIPGRYSSKLFMPILPLNETEKKKNRKNVSALKRGFSGFYNERYWSTQSALAMSNSEGWKSEIAQLNPPQKFQRFGEKKNPTIRIFKILLRICQPQTQFYFYLFSHGLILESVWM